MTTKSVLYVYILLEIKKDICLSTKLEICEEILWNCIELWKGSMSKRSACWPYIDIPSVK